MPNETEIKLAVADARAARQMLRRGGFRISKRRVFEANTVFDSDELTLQKQRKLLRLREAGGAPKVTYKGPPLPSRHKRREERETEVEDAREMHTIFEKLGFRPMWRYEKYRTEFQQPGSDGVATLDETPIGVFVELEGAARWIDRTARMLGFGPKDYITASYGRLFQQANRRGDMVFSRRSQKRRHRPT